MSIQYGAFFLVIAIYLCLSYLIAIYLSVLSLTSLFPVSLVSHLATLIENSCTWVSLVHVEVCSIQFSVIFNHFKALSHIVSI